MSYRLIIYSVKYMACIWEYNTFANLQVKHAHPQANQTKIFLTGSASAVLLSGGGHAPLSSAHPLVAPQDHLPQHSCACWPAEHGMQHLLLPQQDCWLPL